MPAVARSVCINLYDYFEKFFSTADRSFVTILERCPDKSMSQTFQDFLMRFYRVDVDNLPTVIDNLFLLSKIGKGLGFREDVLNNTAEKNFRCKCQRSWGLTQERPFVTSSNNQTSCRQTVVPELPSSVSMSQQECQQTLVLS